MPNYKIDHNKENMFDALGINTEVLDQMKRELKVYTKLNPQTNNSQVFEHLIDFLREKILGVSGAKTTEYEATIFVAGFLIGEASAEMEIRRKSFDRLFRDE